MKTRISREKSLNLRVFSSTPSRKLWKSTENKRITPTKEQTIRMTTSATNIAPVKWAQRKDSIYLTITLSDVKDHKVELTNSGLVFSGNSNGKQYSLNLEFVRFPPIIKEYLTRLSLVYRD